MSIFFFVFFCYTDAGLRASRSFADTVLEKYREYFCFVCFSVFFCVVSVPCMCMFMCVCVCIFLHMVYSQTGIVCVCLCVRALFFMVHSQTGIVCIHTYIHTYIQLPKTLSSRST